MPSEPEKSYENILYMFDGVDTETNEILRIEVIKI